MLSEYEREHYKKIGDLPTEELLGMPGAWLAADLRRVGAVTEGTELVQPRVKQVAESYLQLRNMFDDAPVNVRLILREPSSSAACIRVSGREIIFNDTGLIADIGRAASCSEISLDLDDTVNIDFVFYGLIRKKASHDR